MRYPYPYWKPMRGAFAPLVNICMIDCLIDLLIDGF